MLYVLPLEPLEERYTEQWYRWFAEDCEELGIDYTYIDGLQLGNGTVEVGTVLDAASTCHWKAIQLSKVCRLFKDRKIVDGDKFFTMDMWMPGLEAIPYMATLYGLDVKLYAFLHAGSYTEEDFAAPMHMWAKHFERGWYCACSKIFVGSYYHKYKFRNRRLPGCTGNDIVVTGNPIKYKEMPEINLAQRENIIIFTHRWDKEKRPDRFVRVMRALWELRQDFQVAITTSRPTFRSNDPSLLHVLNNVKFPYEIKVALSKQDYYNELNKAKVFVSTTVEENFGYCLVEALAMGVTPVVTAGLSHTEIVGEEFTWESINDCVMRCCYYLDAPIPPMKLVTYVDKYENSFKHMIRIMTNG